MAESLRAQKPNPPDGAPPVPPRPWNGHAEIALGRPLPRPPVVSKPVQSRPYTPIQLARYPNYGTQKEYGVLCTDFARQAAERLYDDHGRFDRSAINKVINDVVNTPQLPAHHRQNLVNSLTRMAQSDELVNTLNGICAHPGAALKGPAADLVRATLNLPPGQHVLTPAHARKAATMALLGHLRQGQVGSCFATAPAICLHEGSPETVAKDLKNLLETNKLTFDWNGAKFEMPLNKRISTGDLDIEVLMRADGTCHGKALNYGNAGAPYKLHDTPGMQAALYALGIPPPMGEQAVSTALQQMGLAGNTIYRVSKRSIVAQLARNHASPAQPGNPLASALNAYAGSEDVRLLRAWEYTLAGAAEIDSQAQHIDKISMAAFYGPDIPGRPDLGSLARHTGMLSQQLAADPRFRHAPLNAISTQLFNDIQGVMKQRFMLQYDADIKQSTVSSDGVSNRGGFVLVDRLPPNDPTQWVRIDDPKIFQQALAHAVGEAAQRTHVRMQGRPGDTRANQAALQAYAQNLARHIHTDAFIESTARKINPMQAMQPIIRLDLCENLPWEQARGASPSPVFRQYGEGGYYLSPTFPGAGQPDQTNGMQGLGRQSLLQQGDATPVLSFMFDSVRAMRPQLAGVMNKPGAKLPVSNSLHAFSIFPGSFRGAFQDGITAQQWIRHQITMPAMNHVSMQRTEPRFDRLVGEMSRTLRMTPEQTTIFRNAIANRFPTNGMGSQRYTLAQVHQELQRFCASQGGRASVFSAAGESVLSRLAPTPGVIIADTNWADENGNPRHMLAVHNPYHREGRVELHVEDDGGKNRNKMGDNWISGNWMLSLPIGTQQQAGR